MPTLLNEVNYTPNTFITCNFVSENWNNASFFFVKPKPYAFDSAREKLGMIIVCGNMLTSRQIADMAKTFQFDSNRSNFLLYAYRNCSDPQNYVVAANTLQFSSSRNELMRKISKRP